MISHFNRCHILVITWITHSNLTLWFYLIIIIVERHFYSTISAICKLPNDCAMIFQNVDAAVLLRKNENAKKINYLNSALKKEWNGYSPEGEKNFFLLFFLLNFFSSLFFFFVSLFTHTEIRCNGLGHRTATVDFNDFRTNQKGIESIYSRIVHRPGKNRMVSWHCMVSGRMCLWSWWYHKSNS